MAAKLEASLTSRILRLPALGLESALVRVADCFMLLVVDVELIDVDVGDEIVSSKELNLVNFIIQPSIFLSSDWSVTLCQLTLRLLEETASTTTRSGWPGSVLMPSATPVVGVSKRG